MTAQSGNNVLRKRGAENLEKKLQVLIKKVEKIEKFLREKNDSRGSYTLYD